MSSVKCLPGCDSGFSLAIEISGPQEAHGVSQAITNLCTHPPQFGMYFNAINNHIVIHRTFAQVGGVPVPTWPEVYHTQDVQRVLGSYDGFYVKIKKQSPWCAYFLCILINDKFIPKRFF